MNEISKLVLMRRGERATTPAARVFDPGVTARRPALN
jgi:hypothetical protein